MARLEGKVAIVTGGSQGIGRCICETFATEGAKVISADMQVIPYENPSVEGYVVSVTDREALAKFVEYVKEKYGSIDIMVNNAGITRDALIRRMRKYGIVIHKGG